MVMTGAGKKDRKKSPINNYAAEGKKNKIKERPKMMLKRELKEKKVDMP